MRLCVIFFRGTITCVCEKKSCAIMGVGRMGNGRFPTRHSRREVPQLGVGSEP